MADLSLTALAAELLPDATRRLIRTTDALADADYAGPSGCAGWSRAHVVAHLALNAEGLAGALAGVVEGSAVPMYVSDERRDGDIDELATAAPSELRARLLGASTRLADAWDALPADRYGATLERTPGGRSFPVAGVPVMRLQEVEIHHADLDDGYGRADWSPAFAGLLLDHRLEPDAEPPFTAHATDLDRRWAFGTGGPTVTGTAADLGWWVTGRGDGDGLTSDSGDLPRIGA
jgi:maleylpyruvate isomerase